MPSPVGDKRMSMMGRDPVRRLLCGLIAAGLGAMWLGAPSAPAQTGSEKIYRLGHLAVAEASVELTVQNTLPALQKLGFEVGRNLVFDSRLASPDELGAAARALVATKPDVIVAIGGEALRAIGAATRTVPIVVYGPDVVAEGFARSLARPGGNVTGVVILSGELDAKRLELLREAVPAARRIAALRGQITREREASEQALRTIAAKAGFEIQFYHAHRHEEYSAAFAAMRVAGVEALAIGASPVFFRDTSRLVVLAQEARLPTVCEWPSMAKAGCLLGYGPDQSGIRRRLADYIARIFRGEAPGEMPIEQPTKLDLVVNLKTAKALGLVVPESLVIRAGEVIE
jgi:putative tryptophan/tyrosine transport system substrate-binding protein